MIYRPFPLPLADLFSSATFITHFRSHLATFKIPPSLLASPRRAGGGGSFCRFQWGAPWSWREGRWGGSLVGWKGLESSNILLSFPNRLARVPRVEDKRGLMNAPTPSDSPTSAIIIKLYHREWNSWLVVRGDCRTIVLAVYRAVSLRSLIWSLIWNSWIDLEASEVERVSKVSSDISFTGNRKQVNLIVA